jgi:hypothetical protein
MFYCGLKTAAYVYSYLHCCCGLSVGSNAKLSRKASLISDAKRPKRRGQAFPSNGGRRRPFKCFQSTLARSDSRCLKKAVCDGCCCPAADALCRTASDRQRLFDLRNTESQVPYQKHAICDSNALPFARPSVLADW